jgi:hypothetical protein
MIKLNKKEYKELKLDLIKNTSITLFIVILSTSSKHQKIERVILTILSVFFYHLFVSRIIKKYK